ncbi:hypothetical protein V8C37DRAFT_382097 [Trichoderma ceciliae]
MGGNGNRLLFWLVVLSHGGTSNECHQIMPFWLCVNCQALIALFTCVRVYRFDWRERVRTRHVLCNLYRYQA